MHVEHPNVTIWIVVVEITYTNMYPNTNQKNKLSIPCDAKNIYIGKIGLFKPQTKYHVPYAFRTIVNK